MVSEYVIDAVFLIGAFALTDWLTRMPSLPQTKEKSTMERTFRNFSVSGIFLSVFYFGIILCCLIFIKGGNFFLGLILIVRKIYLDYIFFFIGL